MRPHGTGFVGVRLRMLHMDLWIALEQEVIWPAFSSQDSRSEHERQYLLCQGSSGVENTELVKSPRWDWLVLARGSGEISAGTMAPFLCRQGKGGTLLLAKSQEGGLA